MGPAGAAPASRFVQVGDGNGSGWHSAPGGRGGDWNPNPHHSGQWEGHWARSHWAPNHFYGFWGPPEAWSVPHVGWGVPYVPYRYYGDWGALWYPYAEWRGPHGGWVILNQWRRRQRGQTGPRRGGTALAGDRLGANSVSAVSARLRPNQWHKRATATPRRRIG